MKLKNLIAATVLTFAFLSEVSSQNRRVSSTIEIEVGDVEVEIDVEVGRKKLGCQKFGICDFPDVTVGKSYMTMSYNKSLGLLVFKVEIEGLKANQPDKVVYFEGKNSVSIEEPWSLPASIESQLKLPKKFKGVVGEYDVVTKDGYYLIAFKA